MTDFIQNYSKFIKAPECAQQYAGKTGVFVKLSFIIVVIVI